MLVSSFNLWQSFNQTLYPFYKKRFKSEINSFCIWTQERKTEIKNLKHIPLKASYCTYFCADAFCGPTVSRASNFGSWDLIPNPSFPGHTKPSIEGQGERWESLRCKKRETNKDAKKKDGPTCFYPRAIMHFFGLRKGVKFELFSSVISSS